MIRSFNVSYNDFQLDQIINPDEFDVNFADIGIRINQIIDVLNQITDGIGGSGAELIHMDDIAPFTSQKLQGFLQELVTRLQSKAEVSGASLIGTFPVEGITGENVQQQLESLAGLLTQLRTDLETNVVRIDDLIRVNTSFIAEHSARITTAEEELLRLDGDKVSRESVYDRGEVEGRLVDVQDDIYANTYNKDESDALLANKVTIGSNHSGKWQGLDVSDIARVIGAKDLVISNTQPTNPTERLLWFNPSNHQYTLFLDGRWRVNGTPMKIVEKNNRVVLGASANNVTIGITDFDPRYDALLVFQNSTFIAKGYEYTIMADGLRITKPSGSWDAGTTFDFVAHISTPVTL